MSEVTIDKSLLGMAVVHNGLIVLESCQAILRRDYVNMRGKVKLISGGIAGNELLCTEFVGPGMLTAAVLGNIFCAPSKNNVLRVIEEIKSDDPSGILLIVPDYAACLINFTWAKLRAMERGYNVKIFRVTANLQPATQEQSFLSAQFLYKIAGAMSEEGKDIDEIYSVCNHITSNGILHHLKSAKFTKRCEMEIFSDSAEHMSELLANTLSTVPPNEHNKNSRNTNKIYDDHEIAIMINSFGFRELETYTFILDILKQMKMYSLQVKRIYVKPLISSSNTKSFDICVLNLLIIPGLLKYLDFPTSAPAWPKILTSDILELKEDSEINLSTQGKYCKHKNIVDEKLQGPLMGYETGQTFLSIISIACEAVIACTKQLNTLDQEFGNGMYGTSLARGAQAIKDAIQENKMLATYPCVTFTQISHIIERTVDGVQGGLYSLFFNNIAKVFSKYENNKQITVDMWLNALITANDAIKELHISYLDDQVLVAVLMKVQFSLMNALNENVDPIAAFGIAVTAAENFTLNAIHMRSSDAKTNKKFKYLHPEAHAVGIWLRGAYEGIKLKLLNHIAK
ncbi:Dihydroxyacetone kinase 2 [Dufourea novaeangliae]|uniref:Triokinase/FMN cyclase n=1 Tax=Dufourea novaeangliae TaxID=178035 RepID=A0A154PIB7_DUFNO|nr:Dihydroxyacetone kinase 2 [Dufourea novaeangliae]